MFKPFQEDLKLVHSFHLLQVTKDIEEKDKERPKKPPL